MSDLFSLPDPAMPEIKLVRPQNKVTADYSPAHEGGLLWNDAALGIRWPILTTEPILSDKDRRLPRVADFVSPFDYQAT